MNDGHNSFSIKSIIISPYAGRKKALRHLEALNDPSADAAEVAFEFDGIILYELREIIAASGFRF